MELLIYFALIPTLAVTAQWIANRTGLPSILLLLAFGIGLGYYHPPDEFLAEQVKTDPSAIPDLLFALVSLSVAVIMFEGGLSLKLSELRFAGRATLQLCTLGVLITMGGAAVSAYGLLGFSPRLAILLGAILTVTGPTVIGPLLRQIRPDRAVASTLKWEGIVVDPVGAILAVLVFEQLYHQQEGSFWDGAKLIGITVLVGVLLGSAVALILQESFRRFWIPDHLQGTVALAAALIMFAISHQLAHESGLITVTVMGLWLANQKRVSVEHVVTFKEQLTSLLIGCLFVLLGGRLNLESLTTLGWGAALFILVLLFVIRPLSAFISLAGTPLSLRQRMFIGFMAPRGIVAAAVSSIFALQLERGHSAFTEPNPEPLATVTFLVIIATVAFYGLGAMPIGRLLGVTNAKSNGVLIAGADPWVVELAYALHEENIPVTLVDTNYAKVAKAKMRGLTAICMNVLNEHQREDLELGGIGRLLAMTINDEVNSLAVREFQPVFESEKTYQLSFQGHNAHHVRGISENLQGRVLFEEGLTFTKLSKRFEAGYAFKKTTLSEDFTIEDFRQRYGDEAVILFLIGEDNTLKVLATDSEHQPAPGETVLAFIPPQDKDQSVVA